jgi:hypothetical protein
MSDGKRLASSRSMVRRLPARLPALAIYDHEHYEEDDQPTAVAPDGLAEALFDPEPTSSERQSGIRELLESTLAKGALDVDDGDLEIDVSELEDVQPTGRFQRPEKITVDHTERDADRLSRLVETYAQRPTDLPQPEAAPAPASPAAKSSEAGKITHVRRRRRVTSMRQRVLVLAARFSALDLRTRLLMLGAWMLVCSAVTLFFAR